MSLDMEQCSCCGVGMDMRWPFRPQQFSLLAKAGYRNVLCGKCVCRLTPHQEAILERLQSGTSGTFRSAANAVLEKGM